MSWTDEEADKIWQAFVDDYTATWDGDDMRTVLEVPLLAAAQSAVSLFRARASGQVKEDVERVRAGLEWGKVPNGPYVTGDQSRAAMACLSALAQEAELLRAQREAGEKLWREHMRQRDAAREETESLRAKVAEMEKELGEWKRGSEVSFHENKALRAEVERLKAKLRAVDRERNDAAFQLEALRTPKTNSWIESDIHTVSKALEESPARKVPGVGGMTGAAALRLFEFARRALSAESRLAAIRGALTKAQNVLHHGGSCADGLDALNRALEGDAPQEGKDPAPEFANGVCGPHPNAPGVVCILPLGHEGEHSDGTGAEEPQRYPCSDTCTHTDNVNPGHPERVKERSETVNDVIDGGPDSRGAVRVVDRGARRETDAYNDGWRDAVAAVEERVRKALENASAEVLAAIEGAATSIQSEKEHP